MSFVLMSNEIRQTRIRVFVDDCIYALSMRKKKYSPIYINTCRVNKVYSTKIKDILDEASDIAVEIVRRGYVTRR